MSTNPHETEPNAGAALDRIGDMAAALDVALTHPDPDPKTLPAIPPGWHPASEQAAAHLCRVILRGDAEVETIQAQARKEAAAWADMIRAAEARVEERRQVILDFLLKHDATLRTPWFTAFAVRPKSDKVVIHDEAAAIEICKARGWTEAIRVKEQITKAEFDALYNADPDAFTPGVNGDTPIAESVPREPTLTIRLTAAGKKALKEDKA